MQEAGDARVRTLPAIGVGTALVVLGLLTALVWHSQGVAGWERPVISLLRRERLPFTRPFLLMWEPLPFAVVTVSLAWMALRSHRPRLAVSGTLGCVAAVAVTERFLKPLVGRDGFRSGVPVFPSGHVTAAAAAAMFAWLVMDQHERVRSALVLVPVVASWAAVSERVHFPADAVAGVIVGGVVVYCVVVGVEQLASGFYVESRAGRERTSVLA
jgi:membrane-associated phospholipid phosphatase